MAGFTEDQIAELRKPLAGEHVKSREQAGRKFYYIEGWHCIAEANRIFGFDAWDREMLELRCVGEHPRKIGQAQRDGWSVGYIARVRIAVRAGDMVIRREGAGYGSGIDADLGAAHESASKEAETDAMKRALMTFGNPLGLALYDKAQTEVERAAPAAARAAQRATSPEAEARIAKGREAYTRLKKAIEAAADTRLLDSIVKINASDLSLVKELHAPSYDELMQIASARKAELLGGTV